MNAYDGAGFAALEAGSAARPSRCSGSALELFPEHARSLVGLGAALAACGDKSAADVRIHARIAGHRCAAARWPGSEATLAQVLHAMSVQGRTGRATGALKRLVERPEVPFAGGPSRSNRCLQPLRERADFQEILTTLAATPVKFSLLQASRHDFSRRWCGRLGHMPHQFDHHTFADGSAPAALPEDSSRLVKTCIRSSMKRMSAS